MTVNRIRHFIQIVSSGDNLPEMSNPISEKKNKKNISICRLLKVLPRVVSVKAIVQDNIKSSLKSFKLRDIKYALIRNVSVLNAGLRLYRYD